MICLAHEITDRSVVCRPERVGDLVRKLMFNDFAREPQLLVQDRPCHCTESMARNFGFSVETHATKCGVDSRPHKGVPGITWSVFESVIAMGLLYTCAMQAAAFNYCVGPA